MNVLIHRVKMDLSVEQVCFLQFAVPKFVLDSVTTALNATITETKKQATDLRNQGSMQVLKVQQMIRYNVNGILLENAAFSKLEKEVKLRKISANFGKRQEHLHYGIYKDVEGNRHDIVIREGRVGLWKDETIIHGDENAEPYYEVVTNGKVIGMLRDKLNSQ